MNKVLVGFAISAFALAACGNNAGSDTAPVEDETGTSSAMDDGTMDSGAMEGETIEDTQTGAEDSMTAMGDMPMLEEGLWRVDATAYDADNSAAGVTVMDGYATLSGDFASAGAGGKTAGIVFSLPEDVEAAVSGQEVTISVITRGGPFKLAYSTADVGNSGWMEGAASEDWTVTEFTYAVPEMENGRGDFIGIVPTGSQPVEVMSVSTTLKEVL